MPYKDLEKQKAAQRRYYEDNKALYAKRIRDRRNLFRRHVASVKAAAVCADCGIDYPAWVLEFDHVRGVKKFTISSQLSDISSMHVLMEEIAKCEIVCANCHHHRTYMRKRKPIDGAGPRLETG